MMNRLALYHIETLIWIDRLGSFSAAADHLHTSQPAISARVREMEALLGIRLFQRQGRRMLLNPEGRRIVQRLGPLWSDLQSLIFTESRQESARGIIRIGAGEIAAASCLPGFVSALKRDLPLVDLEIDIDLTASLLSRLVDGKIDLAFAAGPIAHPAVLAAPIGAMPLIWLAGPDIADQWNGGAPDPSPVIWSLASQSPIYHRIRLALEASKIRGGSINLCNNVRTMIDIVAAGSGIGLFPMAMVRDVLSAGALKPLAHLPAPEPVVFDVLIRAAESDGLIQHVHRRAAGLSIAEPPPPHIDNRAQTAHNEHKLR